MSQEVITKFKFRDAEVEFDISDADAAERFETAVKRMEEDEKQLPKTGKLSTIYRAQCRLIKDFFDNCVGRGAGDEICAMDGAGGRWRGEIEAMDGAEVAQLYVHAVKPSVYRPAKELKGFAKVFLKAGESKTVTIPLDDKAFRYYHVLTDQWQVETADYELYVASGAANVRLTAVVHVEGNDAVLPYGSLPSYESGNIHSVSDGEFETLLGRPIPDGSWHGELEKNDAICQLFYAKTGFARLVYRLLTRIKNKAEEKGKPDLNILFIYNMPFRAIGKMAGGMVSQDMCESILTIVNGHGIAFLKGLVGIIAGFVKQNGVQKRAKEIK